MGFFKAQFLIIAKVQRRKLPISGRHLKKIIVTLQVYTLLLFFINYIILVVDSLQGGYL